MSGKGVETTIIRILLVNAQLTARSSRASSLACLKRQSPWFLALRSRKSRERWTIGGGAEGTALARRLCSPRYGCYRRSNFAPRKVVILITELLSNKKLKGSGIGTRGLRLRAQP